MVDLPSDDHGPRLTSPSMPSLISMDSVGLTPPSSPVSTERHQTVQTSSTNKPLPEIPRSVHAPHLSTHTGNPTLDTAMDVVTNTISDKPDRMLLTNDHGPPGGAMNEEDRIDLCRLTGLRESTQFPDPNLWLRVIQIFLLAICEEYCDIHGKREWTEGQHIHVPDYDSIALKRYVQYFVCESKGRLDTNVYLYPVERNSAYQCHGFLHQKERERDSSTEEDNVRNLIDYIIDFRAKTTFASSLANTRRNRGELGEPGHFPRPGVGLSPLPRQYEEECPSRYQDDRLPRYEIHNRRLSAIEQVRTRMVETTRLL